MAEADHADKHGRISSVKTTSRVEFTLGMPYPSLSYTALCLNFKHVKFRPCINILTPRPVVYRLNDFVLVAFEFLPYLEIKLTFECTA